MPTFPSQSSAPTYSYPNSSVDYDFLLMETGDYLLLESGDKIILEQTGSSGTSWTFPSQS